LIDQRTIIHDSPSTMHKVLSHFPYLKHVESQFYFDNPVFYDYFYVLEINVSTNISFVDLVQSKIYDLNA
jgi:hypothetical protein